MSGHPFFCELVDKVVSRENPISSDLNEQLLKDNERLSKQFKEANEYIDELEKENQKLKIDKIDLEEEITKVKSPKQDKTDVSLIPSKVKELIKANDILKGQVIELESTVKQLARLLSK